MSNNDDENCSLRHWVKTIGRIKWISLIDCHRETMAVFEYVEKHEQICYLNAEKCDV